MRVAPSTDVSMVNINAVQPPAQQPQQKWKSFILRAAVLVTFLGNLVITYIVMYMKNRRLTQIFFIYITPSPGYFKIWPIIYTSIFLTILHNMWHNIWKRKSSLILILSNCLLMVSSGIWEIRTIASIVVSGFVLATVDNVTIYFWRVLGDQYRENIQEEQNHNSEQQREMGNLTQNSILNQQNQQNSTQIQQNRQSQQNRQNLEIRQSQENTVVTEVRRQCRRRYSKLEVFLVRNVFAFYVGWVTVTGTVIIGIATVYWWGFTLCQQLIIFWITSPVFAIALYLFFVLKQPGEWKYCLGYILSVLWGFIGAGVASIDQVNKKGQC